MKRIIILIVKLLVLTDLYSMNKQDSIYQNLYLFLVSKGDIKKEQIPEIGTDDYKKYIYMFNILKDEFPKKPDLDVPFGIYKFNYSGNIDSGYYILIKCNEKYKVYNQTSLSLIIGELIRIKKSNQVLIDDNLFFQYLEKIIDDTSGIYEKKVIVQTIGNIEYVR